MEVERGQAAARSLNDCGKNQERRMKKQRNNCPGIIVFFAIVFIRAGEREDKLGASSTHCDVASPLNN